MDRKPLFATIRRLLGGKLTQPQVDAIDTAIDAGLSLTGRNLKQAIRKQGPSFALGSLSERYECGGRGPGAVSTGRNDPGGVSYGLFQLASRTGTCAAFVAAEGRRWRNEFGTAAPGSDEFSAAWRAIAAREPDLFAQAQRDFIERTHYRPALAIACKVTGIDLNSCHPAVRNAAWSTAVQHGAAGRILTRAIEAANRTADRSHPGYDRALLDAIYSERASYVLRVAERPQLGVGQRNLLKSIVTNRFADEHADALKMLGV